MVADPDGEMMSVSFQSMRNPWQRCFGGPLWLSRTFLHQSYRRVLKKNRVIAVGATPYWSWAMMSLSASLVAMPITPTAGMSSHVGLVLA